MEFRFVSFEEAKDLEAKHPQLREFQQLIPLGLERNPHITSDFPVLCYMLDGKNLAAHFFSFPDRVYYKRHEYNWAWCGNLFTRQEYRGKGFASALVREQASLFHSKNLAWGGVFSTPEALRIYKRLGFSVLGYAPRYLIIKRISPFLRHHLGTSKLICTAERAYEAFLNVARRLLNDDRAFQREYAFDAPQRQLDDKCGIESLQYKGNYHFDDSDSMMNWKMQSRSIDNLHIVCSTRAGEKAFYLVVRCREINKKALLGRYKGFKLMTVMDYGRFSLDPSIANAIILGSLSLFFASNADACEIISSDEEISRSARRHGLMRVGMGMSFAYSLPANWEFGSDHENILQWHLTHYRGDAFGFE